jgi:hypothetical protein
MAKADLMTGALLVVEAVAAAGALAAVNTAKMNTERGTFALMVKKDAQGNSTGKGGVDLDVALGAGLVLVAALAASKGAAIAPHLAALGAGGLATYGARMGNDWGTKRAVAAAHADDSGKSAGPVLMGQAHQAALQQTTAGVPGHTAFGSLSGYSPRWGQPLGQIDPFVSGFANAQPAYGFHG